MELTILLSKVIGIYLIMMGALSLLKKHEFLNISRSLIDQRLLRLFMGVLVFIAGLFMVLTHNVWTTFQECVVSLFGWMMLVKGFCYIVLDDRSVARWMKTVNNKSRYTIVGLAALILGIYLAGLGFSWF